ncbi:hypothetical protein [Longimicrobium sp.]|uniref:hypothetical protein n=1 Tax=Longimicrobium sp. TaxID=2029185 RepID=UPI002E33617D|nr:hypothetical protein [Longimicrobium sp.]HEX6040658.1 hypothetical protein [Longimicrobium sp.]
MHTPFGRPHGRLTLALLLAASVAAPGLTAQTSAAPVYHGFDQTGFIPFVAPNTVEIRVGNQQFPITMDVGSTGLTLSAEHVPGYSPETASRYPAGREYLSSSRRLWVGRLIPVDVVFPGNGGGVTSRVTVLAVEREALCPDYTPGQVCPDSALRPASAGIRYMGVGFGREIDHQPDATPDRNPFLNVTRLGTTPVRSGAMRSGYVITGRGVHVGLTTANTAGFRFARLQLRPGTQDPRDWAEATMCVAVDDSACAPGTLLTDTGIDYMFLTLPPEMAAGSIPGPGQPLANGRRVSVRIPAAGDAVGTYTFVTGSGDAAAPCGVILTDRKPAAFVNTSNRFFRQFDVLFDAHGGWFGLRPATSPLPPAECR